MAAQNAYVKVTHRPDGTFLTLFPEKDGGEKLNVTAVEAYLDKVLKQPYEKVIVRDELTKPLDTMRQVLLMKEQHLPISETVVVTISEDRLEAKGVFYPPSEGGAMLTRDDIISDMVRSGVKYGVVEESINNFLLKHEYCVSMVLAKATKQVEGSDAQIQYFFNTDLTQKPRVNEDGSVDFHHLDMISPINEGGLLAELTPAVQGKPGIDVCGGLLRPVKVKTKVLRHGKNIRLSEDGLKAYSEVNGHAMLEGEMLFVSDVYEVPANVDVSTGDIMYEGNVTVHGNVITGFSVQAKGDIIVDGVVEGATLIAGGQIILKRGIQGMEKGYLKADGNIISRFIENATVESGGYINADAIMHSKVSAKGDIEVSGKKGFIAGGTIRSGSSVIARTIGSSSGTNTVLEVGIDPAIIQEYHALNKELEANADEMEKVMLTLTGLAKRIKLGEKLAPDKMLQFKTANDRREQLNKRDEEIKERTIYLKQTIDSYQGGVVKAQGTVYPGCKIIISNSVYYVKQEVSYCRFIKEQGDVKMEAF